jgi:nicotinamidase-related amidase
MSSRHALPDLVAPDRSAVLVQELQNGVVGAEAGLPALADAVRATGVIERAASVLREARKRRIPVIHCTAENLPDGFGTNHNARVFESARRLGLENRPGSSSVGPVAALGPVDSDLVLPRLHGLSPLTGSPLDALLRNQGIECLVVMGVSLNLAIPNLVYDAVNRSYQVVLVADAVVGVPADYGRQVIEHSLSLVSTVVVADELIEAWAETEEETQS